MVTKFRKRFMEFGEKMPGSQPLLKKDKLKGELKSKRLAREIVKSGGYKMPSQLKTKKKKKKKRRVKPKYVIRGGKAYKVV